MIDRSIIVNPVFGKQIDLLDFSFLTDIVKEGFFKIVEIWDSDNDLFWQQLNKYTSYISFDISLSVLMQEKKMSIVDTDANVRSLSLNYIFQRIEFISKFGIKNISISSPPNTNEKFRLDAINLLIQNLIIICKYADNLGMHISFEPFDCDYHKKRLIGTTEDFVSLAKEIRSHVDNFHLIWDSAHVYLQERILLESLTRALTFIKRIHFANVCTDNTKIYYGDSHIPFDDVGEISIEDLRLLYCNVKSMANISSVAIEVAVNSEFSKVSSPNATIRHIYDIFERI